MKTKMSCTYTIFISKLIHVVFVTIQRKFLFFSWFLFAKTILIRTGNIVSKNCLFRCNLYMIEFTIKMLLFII